MILAIVIGYHEDTGEAIDGTVFQAEAVLDVSAEDIAVTKALDWVAFEANEKVGGWRAFAYTPTWGPGRPIGEGA